MRYKLALIALRVCLFMVGALRSAAYWFDRKGSVIINKWM